MSNNFFDASSAAASLVSEVGLGPLGQGSLPAAVAGSGPAAAIATVSVPSAATAGATSAAELNGLASALSTAATWDPDIVYGGLALGAYTATSELAEMAFEKSCFEISRARFMQDSGDNNLYFLPKMYRYCL